ncbi:uncharacterized protein BDW47DRAFT_102805 [Aspergillus candidus]|uniref:Uncharacterized protein n=1 Tax=Aspergillus candidus TaxID=41067 RepID=A0A2I2FG61_ASPCN|nr:hypothetical protein BDW47DRAFT_102805 [Aspergillus candidus]PLB39617.1 hypothetical protein BDW47DRAFT_102805 [Aspergillus candidus]
MTHIGTRSTMLGSSGPVTAHSPAPSAQLRTMCFPTTNGKSPSDLGKIKVGGPSTATRATHSDWLVGRLKLDGYRQTTANGVIRSTTMYLQLRQIPVRWICGLMSSCARAYSPATGGSGGSSQLQVDSCPHPSCGLHARGSIAVHVCGRTLAQATPFEKSTQRILSLPDAVRFSWVMDQSGCVIRLHHFPSMRHTA